MILYYFKELYFIILLALLFVLAFLGIQDLRERKIVIFPLLVFDVILNIIYMAYGYYISMIFFIITYLEFFWSWKNIRALNLGYLYFITPIALLLTHDQQTIILSYSFFLIGIIHMVKGFGKGDIKVVDSIALSTAFIYDYTGYPVLLPPVLIIVLIGSLSGLIAYPLYKRSFIKNPKEDFDKIPFVFHLFIGYLVMFILSLHQLA